MVGIRVTLGLHLLFHVDFYMDHYIMYLWYICIWNKHLIIIVIWLELDGWNLQ